MNMTVVTAEDIQIRKEKQQLVATARISRFLAAFEKNLKEMCMERIFKNATRLFETDATRLQFTYLPPLLRREFLDELKTWASNREWTREELEQVFGLVQLLLDQSVTEFDFCVYGDRFRWDQDTLALLVERCPNLQRFGDTRVRKGDRYDEWTHSRLEHFLPGLLRLRSLEHVKIQFCDCLEFELVQLMEAFPNLRSLAVTFKYEVLNHDLLDKLLKLQELESLWLGLSGISGRMDNFAKYVRDELLVECVRHLPRLQEVDIYDKNYAHHNARHVLPERPMALRSVRIKEGFKGWSCEMLPEVTELHLDGPLRDVNEFLGFTKVTSLHLHQVSADDTINIVRRFGCRLEELTVDNCGSVPLDIGELLSPCRKLRVLELVGRLSNDSDPRFCAETFRHLKIARLDIKKEDAFPSGLLFEILLAPGLERLDLNLLSLEAGHVEQLSRRLQNRQILQHARHVIVHAVDQFTRERCGSFVKLLVTLAPRLSRFQCDMYDYVRRTRPLAFLVQLQVPGLNISID